MSTLDETGRYCDLEISEIGRIAGGTIDETGTTYILSVPVSVSLASVADVTISELFGIMFYTEIDVVGSIESLYFYGFDRVCPVDCVANVLPLTTLFCADNPILSRATIVHTLTVTPANKTFTRTEV